VGAVATLIALAGLAVVAGLLLAAFQLPAALGCIVAGLVAVWLARRLDRRT
jgi:Kef-type K+ transport system membrane component KefB